MNKEKFGEYLVGEDYHLVRDFHKILAATIIPLVILCTSFKNDSPVQINGPIRNTKQGYEVSLDNKGTLRDEDKDGVADLCLYLTGGRGGLMIRIPRQTESELYRKAYQDWKNISGRKE